MSAVAAMAGVSPRTVYRHFECKSALFAATIAVGAADFLEQLAGYIQRWPLRQAILTAFINTAIEASEESRNLMHLVVSEDEVYGHWLLTSQRMAPVLADTLRIAASAHPDHEDPMLWEVRASALLAAFSSAYRRWASTSGSDLLELVTHAVDTVLPILGDIRRTTDPVAANEDS
ncbi:MAG: Transcriptional regulator [Mycobacterium sp.]|jgi:AcrR family transcriptional regulator|nr:Transcriptional regulator [Mycobacterium sp.]